jgi:nitrogen fixation protein FixH
MSEERRSSGPWPWIVGGLLLFMVSSSLAFLGIALSHPDALVVDDARRASREEHPELAASRRADAQGWRFALTADVQGQVADVRVSIHDSSGAEPELDAVSVRRIRPAEGGLDLETPLVRGAEGFRAEVQLPRPGRWHLRVSAEHEGESLERTFAVWRP